MASRADQGEGRPERHRDRAAQLSVYFDTSAFAKLLLEERESPHVRSLWREGGVRAASVALLAETRAALAFAHRSGRIDSGQHAGAVGDLTRLWDQVEGLALTESLARRAGELADQCALRGYDAIHLASAEAILDDGDVMVVSDTRLAEAAASLGIEALVPAVG